MRKRPFQIYLDRGERDLLERLARGLGLSMAETVRWALRRLAAERWGEEDPLLALAGSLDAPQVPVDLSTRHEEYAVAGYPPARVAESAPARRKRTD